MSRILVIDDDDHIVRIIMRALSERGYSVTSNATGKDFLDQVRRERPDLIILDISLPEISGFEICRTLRAHDDTSLVMILMLTSRSEVEDKVLGLEIGADDYLPKPFDILELVARVKTLLRRRKDFETSVLEKSIIAIGDLKIDLATATVCLKGKRVDLTRIEYRILSAIARSAGKTLTREQLTGEVWGDEYIEDPNILKVHIRNLRKKIEARPEEPSYILTVHGRGYQMPLSPGV
jgi:DNA-binding response OmpR family regulator